MEPVLNFDIMNLAKSPVRKPVRAVKAKQPEEPKDDTPSEIDLGFDIDPTKTYIFETIKKSEIPRYENLGASCKCFDPVEKRYRDMRYLATAPSIFPEEWDEGFLERAEEPLGFWRNQITCLGEDIRKMEYLMCHPLYEHSQFRVMNKPAYYTIMDKDVQAQINANRHDTELKALEAIKNTPIEDLRPISRIIFNITDDDETAIQNAMFELVKKPKQGTEKQSNAEKVIDNLSNPKLQRSFTIQSAIDNGIISVNRDRMEARLVDGNVFICQLQTKNPCKDITDYSFTPDGVKWYQVLRSKI